MINNRVEKRLPILVHLLGFFRGHERTVRAKKHIIASLILRILNIGIGFLLVPLTLHYLNQTNYGIWLTLSSIINWFIFMDIGLGNGLRNRFAEALAHKKHDLAKIYVSTTYFVLSCFVIFLYLVFMLINPFLNWARILNTNQSSIKELSILAIIVFTGFSIRFVSSLIHMILMADQKAGHSNLLIFAISVLNLIAVFILIKTTSGSLLYLGFFFSATSAAVPLFGGIWFFRHNYSRYTPALRFVKLRYAKDLIGLGLRFFVIQIFILVIYSTNNLLIAQFVGPDQVTVYNIAFKYFNVITMFFIIICAPLWSAYTEAYQKEDFSWIKNTIKKLIQIWLFLVIIVIFMTIASRFIYRIWVGPSVEISFLVSILMACFTIVHNWIGIFHHLINGVSKIKLQMLITIFAGLVNIPLCYFLAIPLKLGTSGVILGTIISLLGSAICAPIQTIKIIKKEDVGIWAA